MDGKVTPKRLPNPRTMLGWDGTDFIALKTDAAGRLVVRGADQLFSFKSTLLSLRERALAGNDGYFYSHGPPEGEVWVVTSVAVIDMTTATTEVILMIRRAEVGYYFHEEEMAKSAGRAWTVQCEKHLQIGENVKVYLIGGLDNDECAVALSGYIMTPEA